MAKFYRVYISNRVESKLGGADWQFAAWVLKKIRQLERNPRGKHIGKGRITNLPYFEKYYRNLRLYYSVEYGAIVVEDVEFSGLVYPRGTGTKDQQRRDIHRLLHENGLTKDDFPPESPVRKRLFGS